MSRVFLSSSCTLVDPRHKYSIIIKSETAMREEKCEIYGFRQSPSSSLKDNSYVQYAVFVKVLR